MFSREPQEAELEQCWADLQPGIEWGVPAGRSCGEPTSDPIGLCASHRLIIFGPGPGASVAPCPDAASV